MLEPVVVDEGQEEEEAGTDEDQAATLLHLYDERDRDRDKPRLAPIRTGPCLNL
jgi:hypothetical protein